MSCTELRPMSHDFSAPSGVDVGSNTWGGIRCSCWRHLPMLQSLRRAPGGFPVKMQRNRGKCNFTILLLWKKTLCQSNWPKFVLPLWTFNFDSPAQIAHDAIHSCNVSTDRRKPWHFSPFAKAIGSHRDTMLQVLQEVSVALGHALSTCHLVGESCRMGSGPSFRNW